MHTCMYIDKVIHLRSMMIFKLPCFQRDGIIYTHMYVMCILIDAPSMADSWASSDSDELTRLPTRLASS